MRRLIFITLLAIFICPMLCPMVAQANPESAPSSIVPVNSPSEGGGEALIAKADQMAKKLHFAASRLIIPLAVIILIVGGLIGIFLKAARPIIIFTILGAVIIYWAPMLVSAIINWIK